jgi:hypothetical protein
MNSAHRFGLWFVLGVAAMSTVMLVDLSRLLGDIQVVGHRAYDARVFTSFKLFFWDTTDLLDAVRLWRTPEIIGVSRRLLTCHTAVDALLFTPSYCILLCLALRYVGAEPAFARRIATVVFLVDWAETWTTLIFVARWLTTDERWLTLIQGLSLLKWSGLGAALVTLAALWVKPTPGSASWVNLVNAVREARQGDAPHPAIALLGLIGLVALFVALVAVPAGGPLEQIPDVLRYQLSSEAGWILRILSTLALVLLAGAVVGAGLASTDPATRYARGTTLKTWPVLLGAVVLSAVLLCVARILDGAWRVSPAAPALVAAALAAAAWLARKARVAPEVPTTPKVAQAAPLTFDERRSTWVGALGGTVLLAGGLGLVRASFPAIVLGVRPATGSVPLGVAIVVGTLTALFGGFVAQRIVETADLRAAVAARAVSADWYRLGPVVSAAVTTVFVAGWLAIEPDRARDWGTTGVIAIGFGAIALVIGLLKWIARRFPPWEVTYSLGLGRRTPWLGLLVVTWVVASVINTAGVYHDARVARELGPATARYPSLDSAFTVWLAAQEGACNGRAIPLVLVAAPGGGIRAAYWTVTTLDRLFVSTGQCAARALFAVSGVSGGSVGIATWVAGRLTRTTPQDTVTRVSAVTSMSRDESLAAAAVGLLLRDLVQPYLGIATRWRNRAALLEDGWIESAGVFGSTEAPLKWADLGNGKGSGWVPILVLNGSSVTDGCRILLTNVAQLPAAKGSDCSAAGAGDRPSGPVSGSIDPSPGLYSRIEADSACGGDRSGMRVVTAALLSARFPIVSPSGALLRCVVDSSAGRLDTSRIVTYSVDGGYYENSGLLTLLQIWSAVAPKVQRYNQDSLGHKHRIEPWIVVADNQYRGAADASKPRRPLELVAPFKALTNNRIVSQNTLEQRAAFAVDSGHLIVIAPTLRPTIAAPLGWVLSATSRAELNTQLKERVADPKDPWLAMLLRQLSAP